MLAESWQVNVNLKWEMTRYIATWLHNTNVTKRSDAKKPEQLFPLPQDVIKKMQPPKSTKEQKERFEALVNRLIN